MVKIDHWSSSIMLVMKHDVDFEDDCDGEFSDDGDKDLVLGRMILFATSSNVPEFMRLIDSRVLPN